jgi:hypothetical protein
MNNDSKEQTKLALVGVHAPCLEAAILNWNMALHKCQTQPSNEQLGEYCKRCDELGRSIARWQAQQPELVEQFGLWFLSHQEVWSVHEPDGASGL